MNCNISVDRKKVFVSAFTVTKSQIHRHNERNMHPSHFIRINPSTITLQSLPPQMLSIVGTSQTRSCRSYRADPASRQMIQKSISNQQQKGVEILSSTMLKNSALPMVASSTSFVGVAFMSAISAGIFSGGLHAIAGTYAIHYMQIVFDRYIFSLKPCILCVVIPYEMNDTTQAPII